MAKKVGILTSTAGLSVGITVNSLTRNESIEQAEARDEEGRFTDIAAVSRGEEVTIDGVLRQDGIELARAGSLLELEGKNYLITTVNRTENNTEFAKASLTAKTADNASIHPIKESTEQEG